MNRHENRHYASGILAYWRKRERRYRVLAIGYAILGALFALVSITLDSIVMVGGSILVVLVGIGIWLYTVQKGKTIRKWIIVDNLLMDVRRRFGDTDEPVRLRVSTGMWDMAVNTGLILQLDVEILFQLFALYESIKEHNQILEESDYMLEKLYLKRLERIRKIVLIQMDVIEDVIKSI